VSTDKKDDLTHPRRTKKLEKNQQKTVLGYSLISKRVHINLFIALIHKRGHAVAQFVEVLRYKPNRSRVRFRMVSLVDSASDRNEYQGYFLGGKEAGE
jgi:hypothetical protein